MRQKLIYILFLITGISSVIFCGCDAQIDRQHIREYVYINSTDHTLQFTVWIDKEDGVVVSTGPYGDKLLVIPPHSSSGVLSITGLGGKTANPSQRAIDVILTSKPKVYLDDISCVVFEESGLALLSNYQYEMLGDRHIKYTYTFTDADFENAKPCEEEEVEN